MTFLYCSFQRSLEMVAQITRPELCTVLVIWGSLQYCRLVCSGSRGSVVLNHLTPWGGAVRARLVEEPLPAEARMAIERVDLM